MSKEKHYSQWNRIQKLHFIKKFLKGKADIKIISKHQELPISEALFLSYRNGQYFKLDKANELKETGEVFSQEDFKNKRHLPPNCKTVVVFQDFSQ